MKALVHIGMGKTGTTAIQKTLAASRAHLARHGVLYPKAAAPLSPSNHQILVWDVLASMQLPRDLVSAFATGAEIEAAHRRFIERTRAQIRKTSPRCLALSAESLFRPAEPERIERLGAAFGPLDDGIEIAAYVRRPSDRFASSLQQALKYSHRIRRPMAAATRKTLEAYAAAFGTDRVRVRLFAREALVGGDVVTDFVASFLAGFGIDPAALDVPAQKNETLSAESVAISRAFRLRFYADRDDRITRDSRDLVAELLRIDAETGAPRPRLRPEVRDRIDYSSADPLWLRDRFGVEFADFDYRRLEAGRETRPEAPPAELGALFAIDPAVGTEILTRLRRTPWAAASVERRAWIDALLTAPPPAPQSIG